mmetsp:Transcript_112978/g.315693  ORF Transcript_112978/g.315693 Transcript_112978/m.315693 type:complete len:319 (-) Transcript_112978:138-1094(-)
MRFDHDTLFPPATCHKSFDIPVPVFLIESKHASTQYADLQSTMKHSLYLTLSGCLLLGIVVQGFQVAPTFQSRPLLTASSTCRRSTAPEEGNDEMTKKERVGNLVADDEWEGLGMELSELVRIAVIEDLKKKSRDFLGKDEYKVGDISKEVDVRVKQEVANLRGKEEYELGDFVLAMDEMSKSMTEELTGKPYEAGDLSREIDSRVKGAVAEFCGKDEYEVGDLTSEVSKRVQTRVEEFVGKDYEFGDISREIENRRRAWVKDFLGEEAANEYQFGDITKKALASFTGKEKYEFGDISKKLANNLFGSRKGKYGKKDE